MSIEQWSKEDFLAYVLIYAAYADFEINPQEREFILKKVERDEFDKILKIYRKHSDIEKAETVRLLAARYCKDLEDKCQIRKDIIKLFFADKDYTIMEKNFFIVIKKIMGLNE
ncbi:MAG: hypothetical protein JXA03_15895 [Bacteroidales bacterium]|nr:hypothetical protein [Bacteroidales bacterium]